MKKLLSALMLTIGIVLLTGCGDGGSSSSANSSTTGNTQFYVSNNDKVDYARVDIEDNSGNIQSSTPIYCPAQSSCNFKANMPLAGSLLFYDANNTMVNAYILTSAPSSIQNVATSTEMLGIYLFSSYDNSSYLAPVVDFDQLANFFANYISTDPNLITNYRSLLGKYYQLQTIGTGLSYADFVTNLNKSLSSGSVLPAKQLGGYKTDYLTQFLAFFNAPPLIKSAYAGVPSGDNVKWSPCSTVFTSNAPKSIGAGIKAFDLLGKTAAKSTFITGLAFEVGGTIYADACKGADPNTDLLKDLQSKMNLLLAEQSKLVNASQFFTDTALNNQLESLEANRKIINDATSAYIQIKNISPDGDLNKYIDSQGGLEKAWTDSANFKKIVDFPTIWNAATAINNSSKSLFVEGLRLKCGLDDRASTDLTKERDQCNVWIRRYQSTVLIANTQAQILLRDVTFALAFYSTSEAVFVGKNITPPGNIQPETLPNGVADWRNYFTNQLEKTLKDGMDSIALGFADAIDSNETTAYFDVYGDIPQELRANLINIGCTNPDDGKLFIQSWIRNGSESSINARCLNNGTYFTSKYLYKKDGNAIKNVLGVVVPATEPQNRDSSQGIDPTRGERQNTLIIYQSQNIIASAFADKTTPTTLDFKNGQAQIEFPTNGNSIGSNFNPNSLYFNFTDSSNLKLSWVWTLRSSTGRTGGLNSQSYKIFIIDCVSSTCGLGSSRNAIGFGRAGGPDPIIFITDNFINSFKMP